MIDSDICVKLTLGCGLVKIAYLKHGAVCVNGAACAYAEFKEFHQALAVSDGD